MFIFILVLNHDFILYNYTLILRVCSRISQLQTQQLMTSQIRSQTEYLVETHILVLTL